MIKEELKGLILKAIEGLQKDGSLPDFEIGEILVETPKNKNFGDYSSNIAIIISKKINKNPSEVAGQIKNRIESIRKTENVKEIKTEGGFINFYLSKNYFVNVLKNVLKEKNNFGKNKNLKNKKVIIDYTDPNPFKEFHIGHLMSNAIGESVSRIFEAQGAKLKRVCYQGDIGMHVAKSIWGMMQAKDKGGFPKQSDTLESKMHFLKSAYANGARVYEADENAKKEISQINKKIYEKSKDIKELYDVGKKWSLEHFDKIYKKLGTKFDYFIFESSVSDIGKEIVEDGLKKQIFEHSDGAIVFKGENYGLHTRVFINSDGFPTYEAKDLGLAKLKYKKYPYDLSYILTGNEVNEYFKVMLCAMGKIAPELAKKTHHIGHGMLRLPEGKMSSRTGQVITGEELIKKLEELVSEKIKDRDLEESEKQEIISSVAIGAIKYSILKQRMGSDIIFDFDKSVSFSGDSGPYLQYSYTRAKSILKKAKNEKIKTKLAKIPEGVCGLEKELSLYPYIIEEAGKDNEPQIIASYLINLSGEFNKYYENNKIVDSSDIYSPYKIALVNAFSIIMENGLGILGITPMERM